PVNRAFGGQDTAGQAALAADIHDLLRRYNRATDGTIIAPGDYLEVVAMKGLSAGRRRSARRSPAPRRRPRSLGPGNPRCRFKPPALRDTQPQDGTYRHSRGVAGVSAE